MVAERMGWTLDYVDSLDTTELLEGLQVWRGQRIARE